MGGFAEYAGALVLTRTLGDHVCVAVQRRADDKISVTAGPEWNGAAAT